MPGSVDVWFAHEALLDDAGIAQRLAALLAPDERARHDRMATAGGRRQQLLARAMQREVLSHYEPSIAPGEWRFERSASGRPALAPAFGATGLNFNLAHTPGLVALAVGRVARIGVDVEASGKAAPLPVARRYFSPREVAALDALPPEQRSRRFLRLWTLKEAYLKAVGEGIAGGLDSMTFTLDESGGVAFERQDESPDEPWQFREFATGGYLMALAYVAAAGIAAVQLREYRADKS